MAVVSIIYRLTPLDWDVCAAVAVLFMGLAIFTIFRRRQTAEQRELTRRAKLTESGRLTDGRIVAAPALTGLAGDGLDSSTGLPDQPTRPFLIYRYRIGGVTYECAQDVTLLGDHIQDFRIDLPVQVRYDARNPGDSIVVSERWTGLRLHKPAGYETTIPLPAQ